MRHDDRIEQVKSALADNGKDALVVTGPENSFYFSGFHAVSDGNYPVTVIPAEGDAQLFVSPMDEDAAVYASTITVTAPEDGYVDGILDHLPDDADVYISGDMTISLYDRLAESLTMTVNDELIMDLRSIKSDEEIDLIQNAYRVAEQSLHTVASRFKEGSFEDVTETTVAAEIEYDMRKQGAHGAAFPTIVATGASSSMPHHTTGSTPIGDGPLLFDIGANVGWYCSDISRTFHIGQPSERFETVYTLVKEAQEAAETVLSPDVATADVDEAARTVMADAGYGDQFTHSTGHGVGIAVHESPNLSSNSDETLEEGMVVTVEPGAYLKGEFGVRIEDAYVITEDGAERLSTMPRELGEMILRT